MPIVAHNIDWSLGSVYTKTLDPGSNVFTFSNELGGFVIVVRLTGDGSTVTWPGTVQWPGGIIPTQTPNGTDVYTFVDDGTTIYGTFLQDFATTVFDPTTVGGGPTLWLDATDLTQGGGIVTAIANKGSTGVDPTINGGQEPIFTSADPGFNNRPSWTCVAGGGTKVVRASSACHGLGVGPYTVVIVGDCGNVNNFAMGSASANTLILGGGGSGDKWQATSDAATFLASGGVATNPSVLVVIFDGVSSKIYVNSKTPVTGNAGAVEDLSALGIMIGNYGSPSSANGQNGPTTQFLVYDSALSQPDVEYLLVGFGTESGISISP